MELLEGHICRLSVKGAHSYALWDKVIITTNLKKSEIYPNISNNLIAPFWARIREFINLYNKCPEVTIGNTEAIVTERNLDLFYNNESTGIHGKPVLKKQKKPLDGPTGQKTSDLTSGPIQSFPLFPSFQKGFAHGSHSSFTMVKKKNISFRERFLMNDVQKYFS